MAGEESAAATLVVLLEAHPALWSRLPPAQRPGAPPPPAGADRAAGRELTADDLVQQVLVFLNTFCLLNEGNRLAVFAVYSNASALLYLSPALAGRVGGARTSATASEAVLSRLQQLARLKLAITGGHAGPPVLSGALSRALCFISKAAKGAGGRAAPRPRILVLHGSPDVPSQYIATMNAIFAAQHHGVTIDACMVGGCESALLQQAAHHTGGAYLRPARPAALLQYLLVVFGAEPGVRPYLRLPHPRAVDFRASCFCHKKSIDLGYVCSVCLSIFCQSLDECSTCGTAFNSNGRPAAAKRRASGAHEAAEPAQRLRA